MPTTAAGLRAELFATGDTTPAPTKAALIVALAATGAAVGVFVSERGDARIDSSFAAPVLWLLSSLFLVRVVGQLVVLVRNPSWLPPMEQWNLTPYRLLLPVQLAILGVMAWIDVSFSRRDGVPATPSPTFGEAVAAFSYAYAASMAARYAVRMARRPGERWFGGTIPITFHFVLAGYVYVFGSFHASY